MARSKTDIILNYYLVINSKSLFTSTNSFSKLINQLFAKLWLSRSISSIFSNWQFCNIAIIFKLNVLFKNFKNVFMCIFQKHQLFSVIIVTEIKFKRIFLISNSICFILQCIYTKQMCDIEIGLSGFYKSSKSNCFKNWIWNNWDITGNK